MRLFNYNKLASKPANSKNRNLGIMSLLLLLLTSVGLYALIPKQSDVSMSLFYVCFSLMIVSNYIYFKAKKKKNYLDFDSIFIFIYCLVGFSTTFFYDNDFLFKAMFVGFPVEEKYINAANLLFLIGLQSYMFGSLKKIRHVEREREAKAINTQILGIVIVVLCIAFVASGGLSFYRSVYTRTDSDGSGISKHILLLLVSIGIAAIVTEFYNKKVCTDYKINQLLMCSILIVISLLLWVGNRTAASQLLLPIICLYTMLFLPINLKRFLGLLLIGIVSMWGIQRIRSNENFSLLNPILLISDLTIPARTTYSALDYADIYGHSYGKTMSMGVIGIIPFLASTAVANIDELDGSAELLSEYTFDVYKTPFEYRIGLGTTIISDIYLSFGLIGVILLMYFLGYFINKYTIKALLLNYYSLIIVGGMAANSVFVVRASYTHPIRYVLWALIIAYINKSLLMQWRR